MDFEFEEEIQEYLQATFSPEMQGEVRASLMVFDAFGYEKASAVLADVLFDIESSDKDLTQMKFLGAIHESLNALLKAHLVTVQDDTDLSVKNQILGVLYRLQHLEDPTPTLRILESSASGEEQLARIVQEYSVLDEAQVLMAVESIDESSLNTLRTYLYKKEEDLEAAEEVPATELVDTALMVKNLKDFFHVHGNENLGYQMLDNGIQPGHDIKLYYPYISDQLVVEDDLQSAKNILSLFFIARDTFNDPLKVYRAYSEKIISGSERIMKIEVKLAELLNALRQYQKALDDSRRVSVTQHQV